MNLREAVARERLEALYLMEVEAEAQLAELRSQVQLQEKYVAHLQKQIETFRKECGNGSEQPAVDLSGRLPDQIAVVLLRSTNPMRARDIALALDKEGVETSAEGGLLPQVLAALGRRKDLFRRVERGVYDLVNRPKGKE